MVSGPGGIIDRPLATSKIQVSVTSDRIPTLDLNLLERDIKFEHNIDVIIDTGTKGGIDDTINNLMQAGSNQVHFTTAEFAKKEPSFAEVKLVAEMLKERVGEEKVNDTLVQTSSPTGIAGGPRPLASSNITIKSTLDISGTPDSFISMGVANRASQIEDALRAKTDTILDVGVGPSFTFVFTRQKSIPLSELDEIVSEFTIFMDQKGGRLIDVALIANSG